MSKAVNILLVDDDQVDVMAVRRAFKRAKIANPISVAHDGLEALQMLRGEGDHDKIGSPYIILLDLNMPRMTGLEFLDELRDDPVLRSSIVFILTTSADDRDKTAAYEKFVAGYMVKSNVGEDFLNMIGMLDAYWKVVEFPEPDELSHD